MSGVRPAVLCLHGFTGAPFELQPLADALAERGWRVELPTLAGHGAGTAELAAATWRDWLKTAEQALMSLVADTGQAVGVVGGSMGGLLAIRLARMYPSSVAGLVLLAPPLRLRPIEQKGIGALTSLADVLGLGPNAVIPKTGGPDVTDAAVRERLSYGSEYPLAALSSFLELQSLVRDDLGCVAAPALVVHGRRDRTVPLAVSDEIASNLGSIRIERLLLNESAHLLALDVEHQHLAKEVMRFLETLAAPVPSAAQSG